MFLPTTKKAVLTLMENSLGAGQNANGKESLFKCLTEKGVVADVVTFFFHQRSKITLSVPHKYYYGVSCLILQYHSIETPVPVKWY